MRDVVVVKLGGSLLTDKEGSGDLRGPVLERLAREVAEVLPELDAALLLTHGSGSFGHVAARRHGLSSRMTERAPTVGISRTQAAAHTLHRHVIDALVSAGVPCFSYCPSSAAVVNAKGSVEVDTRALELALDQGLVPVAFGDVVVDPRWGARICSTETLLLGLASALAKTHRISQALFLGETAGVYDAEGHTIDRISSDNLDAVVGSVGEARGADVTGGMKLRIETSWALARLGVRCLVCDGTVAGNLAAALSGRPVDGTWVISPSTE